MHQSAETLNSIESDNEVNPTGRVNYSYKSSSIINGVYSVDIITLHNAFKKHMHTVKEGERVLCKHLKNKVLQYATIRLVGQLTVTLLWSLCKHARINTRFRDCDLAPPGGHSAQYRCASPTSHNNKEVAA